MRVNREKGRGADARRRPTGRGVRARGRARGGVVSRGCRSSDGNRDFDRSNPTRPHSHYSGVIPTWCFNIVGSKASACLRACLLMMWGGARTRLLGCCQHVERARSCEFRPRAASQRAYAIRPPRSLPPKHSPTVRRCCTPARALLLHTAAAALPLHCPTPGAGRCAPLLHARRPAAATHADATHADATHADATHAAPATPAMATHAAPVVLALCESPSSKPHTFMVQNNAIARRVERCVVNRAVIVYRVISSDLNINLVRSRVLDARFPR